MRREQIREGDLISMKFWLRSVRASLEQNEISTDEKNRRVREAVFQRLMEEPVTADNYGVLQLLCDAYDESSTENSALPNEEARVKLKCAHALIAAYFHPSQPLEVKLRQLAASRVKLVEARELVAMTDDSELVAVLQDCENYWQGITEQKVKTRIGFNIPLVLPIPDGKYQVVIGEHMASVQIAYRLPGTARPGRFVTENAVGISAVPSIADGLTLEPADYTVKVELPTSRRISLGFTTVVVSFPGALSLEIPEFDESEAEPELIDIPGETEEERGQWLTKRFDRIEEQMLRGAHKTREPEAVCEAVSAVNRLISGIRLVGNQYHMDRLSTADIDFFDVSLVLGGGTFLRMSFTPGQPVWIHGPTAGPTWLGTLRDHLLTQTEPSLEQLLILDAKRYLLHGELRLAVLNVNAALEAFLHRHIRERLSGRVPDEELETFLRGETVFEKCKTRLRNMAEGGNKAAGDVAKQLSALQLPYAEPEKPPVHKLVTKMRQGVSFGIRTKELDEQIEQIRMHRNEVAHGQFGDADLNRDNVQNSIDALEQFIQLAIETLAAQPAVQGGE